MKMKTLSMFIIIFICILCVGCEETPEERERRRLSMLGDGWIEETYICSSYPVFIGKVIIIQHVYCTRKVYHSEYDTTKGDEDE